MASSVDYIEYVCEQLGDVNATYKKMFGDYTVYVNCKPVLLVCDNTVYVKKLPQVAELLAQAPVGTPYGGAKEHYMVDPENSELLKSVVDILEPITSLPKKRK